MAVLRSIFEITHKHPLIFIRYNSKYTKKWEYQKCYKILGIPEDSDQEEVREAYLKLVKKYHPDSGNEEADSEKFTQIDAAFKTLINKFSRERWDVEFREPKVQEQHTAPQHRQYLSYGGMGSGTPFQREKQYLKARALEATENVLKHRMSKVSAEEGALLSKKPVVKHKIKTKYGFDRLVEDLIQESMSKGEFNNLSGTGKPLPSHQNINPYVDFVTHKLNEVLIDNGFIPEWILLQKEIREKIRELRFEIAQKRADFGAEPLEHSEMSEWLEIVREFVQQVDEINKMVDKFNLVVPILEKQMIRVNLEREAMKILKNGEFSLNPRKPKISHEETQQSKSPDNLLGYLEAIFKTN